MCVQLVKGLNISVNIGENGKPTCNIIGRFSNVIFAIFIPLLSTLAGLKDDFKDKKVAKSILKTAQIYAQILIKTPK